MDSNKDTGNANSNTAMQEDDASQHVKNPPEHKELKSGVVPVEPVTEAQKQKGQDWNK